MMMGSMSWTHMSTRQSHDELGTMQPRLIISCQELKLSVQCAHGPGQ